MNKMAKALSSNDLKAIKECAARVYHMAMYNAVKNDAKDISEYVAGEIIDLSEWMSPDIDWTKHIAVQVMDLFKLPPGVSIHIKKHFDLPY